MRSRYFLLAYFAIHFAVTFFWRRWVVHRGTGINPVVLPSDDSTHGYVGNAFRAIAATVAVVVVVHTWWPGWLAYAGPMPWISEIPYAEAIGLALMILSLAWTAVAQAQMGGSWRIGVDRKIPTALVATGLFRISRNPIYLGLRVTLLGLFVVLPNAATFAALLCGEVMMQVQVRLEEAHLLELHGEAFEAYRSSVRRWL